MTLKGFYKKRALILLGMGAVIFFLPSFQALAVSIDFGDENTSNTIRIVQLLGVMTILSLAPSLLVMVTSFTRIIVVLSFLRNALGLQQSPPNTVLISLALFLTFFIMSPVVERSYQEGLVPYSNGQIDEGTAWHKSTAPFHAFMRKFAQEKDINLFIELSGSKKVEKPEDLPLSLLTPAFMISELRRAFEIGFLIFLPFLIIDLVIAAVLMSMGMMMVPPAMIALPFKVIFFVLVDGWHLIVGSLVRGFS